MDTVHLNHGPQIHVYHQEQCWRADVSGTHYVSETWGGLVTALGLLHSRTVRQPEVPKVVESDGNRVVRVLRDHVSSLAEKQACYREAKSLVQKMDTDVGEIADQITNPPPDSFNARNFARKLDKKFDEVTYEELVQHEHNLVRRNGLIRELATRFQCK